MNTIKTWIPQPERHEDWSIAMTDPLDVPYHEFVATHATAGKVTYRIDCRVPADVLLEEIDRFTRELDARTGAADT